ncbi:MAG TPA: delta-60 repeat domain-containing protein [Fimbriiglobus sp.]|nr:delta-60 repeat domain-containing protein [Fimbriiglobus sp.]
MPRRSVRLGLHLPLEDRLTPSPAGDLDPAFGGSGIATINFPPPQFFSFDTPTAEGLALQPNGQSVIVGTVPSQSSTGGTDFGVTRLLFGGQPDPTFGALGLLEIAFDQGLSNDDAAHAVAVQPDGKIVIAGYATTATTGKDFAVVRLNPDGSPDKTFAGTGFGLIPFTSGSSTNVDDEAFAVAIQPDGKIVLAGSSRLDFAAARLNADGTLDTTFAGKGVTTVVVSTGGFNADAARAMAIQPDGRIVLAGYSDGNAFQYDFAVVRLNANGTPDTSFGGKGRATIGFDLGGSNEDKALGVALQSGGQIVVVGRAQVSFGGFGSNVSDMAIARLNPDGTPDLSFGAGGTQVVGINLGGSFADEARAVAVQPDDKIVVAGSAERLFGGSSGGSFVVMRLNADGTFDTDFGNAGKTVVSAGAGSFFFGSALPGANAVAIQPDGNIVSAGAGAGTFMAMRMLGAAPPPVPEPPLPPEPPTKEPILPTPLDQLPRLPDPVLAGGAATGTATVLFNQDGTFAPGTALNFFPGEPVGVRVAVADVNGDLVPDYIGGTGVGVVTRVTVIDGKGAGTLASFQPFEAGFTGGVFVTAADIDRDGKADIIVTPDRGGGPVVAVYSSAALLAGTKPEKSQIARFMGIDDPAFRGGARAAAGDVNADGTPDLVIAAGFGGGPRVSVVNGAAVAAGSLAPGRLTTDFFAFESGLRNGAFVAAGDFDGDGFADLAFGGGPGGAPRVRLVSGKGLMQSGTFSSLDQLVGSAQVGDFFAGDPGLRGGVRVLLRDVDGDGKADLTVGSGEGEPGRVTVYAATSLTLPTPVVARTQTLFGGDPLLDGVYVG